MQHETTKHPQLLNRREPLLLADARLAAKTNAVVTANRRAITRLVVAVVVAVAVTLPTRAFSDNEVNHVVKCARLFNLLLRSSSCIGARARFRARHFADVNR